MKDFIVASDTDSMYIELSLIIKHMQDQGIEITPETKNEIILKIADKIQIKSNEYLNELAKNLFNTKKHYFQLKQEVIAQSIIITGKRRYAMFITNKEGVEIPPDSKEAFDAKGLELFKSNMNKIFRTFGENLIKNILFGKPKHEIDQSIIDLYRSLKKTNIRLLGKPTGVNYIKKYTVRKPTSGEIFSKLESGAPANTKGAIRYNDLIKFKRLDKKYESIIEGDKIFIINLKPNPYHIETIGIPNGKMPPEIEEFIENYIDIDLIFESILLGKLKDLYKDINFSFPELNPNVSKFFSYV